MSSKFNKTSAKMAFNDAVEISARLASFATSRFHGILGDTTIERVSEQLAHKDLVTIALAVRRLAEITDTTELLRRKFISEVRPYAGLEKADFYPIKKRLSAWTLIGILIHHLEFEVFKTDARVRIALGQAAGDVYEIYKIAAARKHIDAVCLIRSDKSELILFAIADFVSAIAKFIEVVQTELAGLDVYVGHYQSDN